MKIKCPYCKIYNRIFFRKKIDYTGDKVINCKHCGKSFYIPIMGSVGEAIYE